MPVLLQTTLLLICSNVFMTFAWYAHLKDMSGRPWVHRGLGELGRRALCVRAIRGALHEAAAEAQLPVGGHVHLRGRLLRISGVVTAACPTPLIAASPGRRRGISCRP